MRFLERVRLSSLGRRRLSKFASNHLTHDLYAPEDIIANVLKTGDLSDPPATFNFTRDVIEYWAKRENDLRADRTPALWLAGNGSVSRKCSYRELSHISARIAGVFQNIGLQKGDGILICLPKCPEFWFIILAALRFGLEISIVTTQATSEDLRFRIENFKPKVILSEKVEDFDDACARTSSLHKICLSKNSPGWKNLNSLMKSANDFEGNPTSKDDPCMVFFTSGTTGKPKMVEHSHVYTLAHVLSGKYYQCLKADDIFWCMTDTGWAKLAWGTFPTWLYGAGMFVETSTRFSAENTLETLRRFPVTKLCAPPTVYRQLVANTKDPSAYEFRKLSDCVSAGEPLNPEAYREWKNLTGLDIREGYGQTETTLVASTPRGHLIKPGSMGFPMGECQVRVLDDDGNPVQKGETGHMAISLTPRRPLGLFKEYRGNPEKNSSAFRNGFYLTGDKVYEDEDGYLWFVSRADDVITSSGYRIGPFEIESVLLEHDAVVESAVVGVPDPQRFEAVKAFIVVGKDYASHDTDALKAEIQAFVKRRTAPYKYPRLIEFVDSLPKTVSGKIQRNVLRDMERNRLSSSRKILNYSR